jgi:hypothetical protein
MWECQVPIERSASVTTETKASNALTPVTSLGFGCGSPRRLRSHRCHAVPTRWVACWRGVVHGVEVETPLDRIYPYFKPIAPGEPYRGESVVHLVGPDRFIVRPWLADLIVMYAIDEPTQLHLVQQRDIDALGINAEQLHHESVANLGRLVAEKFRAQEYGAPHYEKYGGSMYACLLDGNFEASTVLLDEIWDEQATRVRGDLVATIAARDILSFSGTDVPGGIEALRVLRDSVWASGDHLLSRSLLVRRHGAWRLLNDR